MKKENDGLMFGLGFLAGGFIALMLVYMVGGC
jgi:hypothetical protein